MVEIAGYGRVCSALSMHCAYHVILSDAYGTAHDVASAAALAGAAGPLSSSGYLLTRIGAESRLADGSGALPSAIPAAARARTVARVRTRSSRATAAAS